jgi:hypothetical protein
MTVCFRVLFLCGLVVSTNQIAIGEQATEPVSFVHQVRPVLSDKCFACHGPDEQTREADLRFDLVDAAIEAGSIVPGKPEESELMRRILSDDPDERMPPEEFHKELSNDEIETIRRWISEGAHHEQHWSYRPLVRPKVPAIKHNRNRNVIDAFILSRLEKTNLDFSPQADKTTVIRRLYFDLLGVPPTYEEVQRFVTDESELAWQQTVDRVLRDERFGERMAVFWLDLVRYADTIGYHSDTHMQVSAYRDYVIDSFNQNMPFDQFTIEQLAGDLLPEPTIDQRIASGYNRLLQTTEEGGAQAKEYITIYAADRVRNVSGVWMGQTVGCAQCHDHKYDPITTKDFYSMAAFFADIKETAVGKQNPNMTVVRPDDQKRIDALESQIAELQIDRVLENDPVIVQRLAKGQQDWETETLTALSAVESIWKVPEESQVASTGGIELKKQEDGSYLSTAANPETGTYTFETDVTGKLAAIRLETFPDASFPRKEGFSRGNGNFVLSKISIFVDDKPVKIASAAAGFEQREHPITDALDDNDQSGWAVEGHTKTAKRRMALFRFESPLSFESEAGRLRIELRHHSPHKQHLIGRFRISLSDQESVQIPAASPIPDAVIALIKSPADQRTDEQHKQLADHYRGNSPELADARKQLADTTKQLDDFRKSLRTMLVSESLREPRMTRILPRGNWLDDSGDVVQPAVPEFLPHQPISDRRANRLDLANWLVADDNPLTARTFVNRLWKMFYGRGLARNLDDLGGQGEAPTHPELLDWLSVEFRESGWDIKAMVRLMVTSGAYAQVSTASETGLAADPSNRSFARQTPWRVEAEFVRDTALSLSGLLVGDSTGGYSVKPYQPAGYWQHLNFPVRKWQADQGEKLYRRSLYTFWCRTFPHPSMIAFDAPSREECTAERARSNIPQQALVLLNDPIFVEAARVFAERIMRAEEGIDQRIRWAFREAVSRDPEREELELLRKLFEDQHHRYSESAEDAKQLLSVGAAAVATDVDPIELAAWTQVGRTIINAYETTSRF